MAVDPVGTAGTGDDSDDLDTGDDSDGLDTGDDPGDLGAPEVTGDYDRVDSRSKAVSTSARISSNVPSSRRSSYASRMRSGTA